MRTCAVGVAVHGGTADERTEGVVIAASTPQTLAVPASDGVTRLIRVRWSEDGVYVHNSVLPASNAQGFCYRKRYWTVAAECGYSLMDGLQTKGEAIAAARRFLPLANWHQPASVLQSCPSLRRDVLALRRTLWAKS